MSIILVCEIEIEQPISNYFINESRWAVLTTSFCPPKCLCGYQARAGGGAVGT